jgi:hypothetical protein
MNGLISIASLIIVMVTTLTVIWGGRWRWILIALGLQYVVVFLLVSQVWPISQAAIKLITGWMAAAVLGASHQAVEGEENPVPLSGKIFRILAGCLMFVLVFSIAGEAQKWIPLDIFALNSGLTLIGMGLFQLGLTSKPLNLIVGLLTTISGFEVIYAAVVSSVLVTGLLSLVTMGLSLVGAYWLISPSIEET